MIRPVDACPVELLPSLLDETLGPEETDFVSSHLESCGHCQGRLERLAGDASLWEEARTVLTEMSVSPTWASGTWAVEEQGGQLPLAESASLLPSLDPSDDPTSLGRLDGYEIKAIVGWGGMGVVLRAHDKALHRTVAIKVLHPHLAANGSARRRFAREARAAAAINHASVVPIHAVNADHSSPYLVMAFVSGASLQDRIDREGPLSVEETLRIGLQIAEGLSAAHAQGVVHRDVKPGNILLDHGQDRVLLSDFGLAQALDDASLTATGVIAGTPQYMSPEQARGEALDARSDLFSLGGVLYAMLTGRPPFRAPSTLAVLRLIDEEPPRPIENIQPQTPEWMVQLVELLLSKSRSDRPEDAGRAVMLLRQCLLHVTGPAQPLPPELVGREKRNATTRWSRGLAAIAAFLLIALITIIWRSVETRTAVISTNHSNATERGNTDHPATAAQPASVPAPVVSTDAAISSRTAAESVGEASDQGPALSLETAWDDGLDPMMDQMWWSLKRLDN